MTNSPPDTSKANTKVAESLYRKALGDGSQSVTAAIFWLKTRAGWKETLVQQTEVTYVARMPDASPTVDEWISRWALTPIAVKPIPEIEDGSSRNRH